MELHPSLTCYLIATCYQGNNSEGKKACKDLKLKWERFKSSLNCSRRLWKTKTLKDSKRLLSCTQFQMILLKHSNICFCQCIYACKNVNILSFMCINMYRYTLLRCQPQHINKTETYFGTSKQKYLFLFFFSMQIFFDKRLVISHWQIFWESMRDPAC